MLHKFLQHYTYIHDMKCTFTEEIFENISDGQIIVNVTAKQIRAFD
jgi:hypothetical protein